MNGDQYSPIDEPHRRVAYGPLIWGAILVIVGAGWLLGALGVAVVPWRAILAAILIVLGIVLLAAAGQGAAPDGLFAAGITLSIVLALLSTFSAAFSLPLSGGVGNRSYQPTAETLEPAYHLVAGQLALHLDDIVFPEGETHIAVNVTFGTIFIDGIASDVAVSLDARATAGLLVLLDNRQDGISIEQQVVDPDFAQSPRRLVIDARVGFGQVEIYR